MKLIEEQFKQLNIGLHFGNSSNVIWSSQVERYYTLQWNTNTRIRSDEGFLDQIKKEWLLNQDENKFDKDKKNFDKLEKQWTDIE